MHISFTMTMHVFFVLPLLLQMVSGRPQQQTQLVTQMLPPNQAATLGQEALGPIQGPAASLGQILVNLLNYKLQWLNQLAGQFTGLSPTQGPNFKPGLLGALGALSASQIPGAPGLHGQPNFGHPHHGFPFMTTLITTLSGNAPTVPGITISGAPVNHLATPGLYPGVPTTAPPQDFHWIPPFAPEPPQLSTATSQAQPVQTVSQTSASQPSATLAAIPKPPQPTVATIPVIPAIDDVPAIQTIVQPAAAAPLSTAPAAAAPAPAATAPAATSPAAAAPAVAAPTVAPVETRF